MYVGIEWEKGWKEKDNVNKRNPRFSRIVHIFA